MGLRDSLADAVRDAKTSLGSKAYLMKGEKKEKKVLADILGRSGAQRVVKLLENVRLDEAYSFFDDEGLSGDEVDKVLRHFVELKIDEYGGEVSEVEKELEKIFSKSEALGKGFLGGSSGVSEGDLVSRLGEVEDRCMELEGFIEDLMDVARETGNWDMFEDEISELHSSVTSVRDDIGEAQSSVG